MSTKTRSQLSDWYMRHNGMFIASNSGRMGEWGGGRGDGRWWALQGQTIKIRSRITPAMGKCTVHTHTQVTGVEQWTAGTFRKENPRRKITDISSVTIRSRNSCRRGGGGGGYTHRVHRVMMAAFWRTFHHEGKISPGWCGRGARPTPFTTFTKTSKVLVYAPAEWADTLTLFHLYQYVYSVGTPTPAPDSF